MKRMAMLMLLSCALVMISRWSPTQPHFGQVVADQDDGDDDGDDDGGGDS